MNRKILRLVVVCCFFPHHVTLSLTIFATAQLVVGGLDRNDKAFSSVKIFPPPSSDMCSVPDHNAPEISVTH